MMTDQATSVSLRTVDLEAWFADSVTVPLNERIEGHAESGCAS